MTFFRRTSDLTVASCGLCGWTQAVSPEFAGEAFLALRQHNCAPLVPISRAEVIDLRDRLTQWIEATDPEENTE